MKKWVQFFILQGLSGWSLVVFVVVVVDDDDDGLLKNICEQKIKQLNNK